MLNVTENALIQLKSFLLENEVPEDKMIRLILIDNKNFDLVTDIAYEDDHVERLGDEEILVIQDTLYGALESHDLDFNKKGEMTIIKREE